MTSHPNNIPYRYSTNIFINSSDRLSGINENFLVAIQDRIPGIKLDIGVVNLAIPYSYYNTNHYNNTFSISVSGNTYNPITIPPGNYTSTQFTTEINNLLGATMPSIGTTINTITGLLSINSGGAAFTFSGDPFWGTSSASAVYSSTGGVITLPYVINLAGTEFIDIRTDLPIASSNSHDTNRYLLQRVYVNTTPFNTIFYTDSAFNYVNCSTDTINMISLSLYDDRGNLLELNGKPWQITLELSSNNS